MPAASYADMRRRRMARAQIAVENISEGVKQMTAALDRGEIPSGSLVTQAAALERALAELDALEELYGIGAVSAGGPRYCAGCGHPERGHRVPPGSGGARWPLESLDCPSCPDGRCRLDWTPATVAGAAEGEGDGAEDHH